MAIDAASAAIVAAGGPECRALPPPEDAGCLAALTTIEAELAIASTEFDDAITEVSWADIQLSMAVGDANAIGLGAWGIPRPADPIFISALTTHALKATADILSAWLKFNDGVASLSVAMAAGTASTVLRPIVEPALTPIIASVNTIRVILLPTVSTCIGTQFASMASMAGVNFIIGLGPGGGFNPPGPAGAFDSDPFDPIFGPTTLWENLAPINVNFPGNGPNDFNSCQRETDCINVPSSDCVQGHRSGPSCPNWKSWGQVWFEYRIPVGAATTETVIFDSFGRCNTDFDCVDNGQRGACINQRCTVPAGTAICAGPRGYGEFPAASDFEYTDVYLDDRVTHCVFLTTQDPAFQYELGDPHWPDASPAVTCSRAAPDGTLMPGWVMSIAGQNEMGCRASIRTDGRPEDAGRQLSRNFVVEQAWCGVHIAQRFTARWTSQVPPGNCYTYDSISQSWNYTPNPPQCPY